MKSKDPNFVVKLEKAISDRWGEEAIQNPKKFWTPEKEEDHLEQLKSFYKKKFFKQAADSKQKYKGFLVSKKLLSKEVERECPVCLSYSFSSQDDVYMTKFECCFKCYIQYVEDREERWASGWRPKKEQRNGDNT